MRGLTEIEACVMEIASGTMAPVLWIDSIMTPAIDGLIRRRLLAYASQPEASSTDTQLHYALNVTPAGRLVLQLYRQGIR